MTINVIEFAKSRAGRVVLLFIGLLILWIVWAFMVEAPRPSVRLNSANFQVEAARTQEQRRQGLSGRTDLLSDRAMLFVHEVADKHCYWMKDMKFSIDIMWFDANRKLVHVEKQVSPDSYPKEFCSSADALYVLETRAGMADFVRAGLGDELFLLNL